MAIDFQLAEFGAYLTVNTASNTVYANAFFTANSYGYANGEGVGTTYILDDLSYYFDGVTTNSFTLTVNSAPVTPTNPNMINIVIGGIPLTPASYVYDFHNLSEISTFKSGFTLSGSTITFATAPTRGMSFYGTYRTSQDLAPSFSYKQTPFSALNIMFGP